MPLHPGRPLAALLEPGVVPDQDPVRVAQGCGDVAAQVVADTAGVPPGGREQPLHPVRACFPCVLSQRPASLALQPGQHPGHTGTGTDPDLPAEEPARDQRERVIKPCP
jgi:hypothetical protein